MRERKILGRERKTIAREDSFWSDRHSLIGKKLSQHLEHHFLQALALICPQSHEEAVVLSMQGSMIVWLTTNSLETTNDVVFKLRESTSNGLVKGSQKSYRVISRGFVSTRVMAGCMFAIKLGKNILMLVWCLQLNMGVVALWCGN